MQRKKKKVGYGLNRTPRLARRVAKAHGDNAVRAAVDSVGGPLRAAVVMGVSLRTTYEWIRKGEIRLLKPALRLARMSGAKVEQFAGGDDAAGADQ